MVIECPSCHTKFAVDAQQLAEVENPRFHCSRCNHYFEHGSSAATTAAASVSDSMFEPQAFGQEEFEIEEEAPTVEQLELLPQEKKGFDFRKFREEEIEKFLDDEDGEPVVRAQWPVDDGQRPYAVDLSEVEFQEHPTPPPEAPRNWEEAVRALEVAESEETVSATRSSAEDVDEELLLTPMWTEPPPQEQWTAPVDEELWSLDRTISSKRKIFEFPERLLPKVAVSSKPKLPTIAFRPIKPVLNSPSGFQAVVLACSLPLVLTLFFWGWSLQLAQTPQLLADVFHFTSKGLPKLPPPGLALVGLSSNVLTLDDGTKVLEIRGDLFNATLYSYSSIRLEAKTYDQANRQLENIVVGFNNSLKDARVESLKVDSITSLQDRDGTGGDEVKPNMRAPFRLIIPTLTQDASWFSARVYSVEQQSTDAG